MLPLHLSYVLYGHIHSVFGVVSLEDMSDEEDYISSGVVGPLKILVCMYCPQVA